MSIPGWAPGGPRPTTGTSSGPRHAGRARRIAFPVAVVLLGAACDPGLGVDPSWGNSPLPDPAVDHVPDDLMADVGAELFRRNCVACHSVGGGDVVGPDLSGVTHRRPPDWIRGMIARPDSMIRVDPVAGALLIQYQVPMPNRRLDAARVRALLEFLWRADHGPA